MTQPTPIGQGGFAHKVQDTVAERDQLRKLVTDFQEWCRTERGALGAVDGYDYDSGQEYGLRRAEIEIEKRLKALATKQEPTP